MATGFALKHATLVENQAETNVLRLEPWANLKIAGAKATLRKISISTQPHGVDSPPLAMDIGDHELSDEGVTVKVPAGKTVIRDRFKIGDSWVAIPCHTLQLTPGENRHLILPPLSREQRRQAEDMKKTLNQIRDKRSSK